MVSYSVIIPAFNEETYLPKTLSILKEAMSCIKENGEIIVVDNNSTDSTYEIAKEHGVNVVREPINQISRARKFKWFPMWKLVLTILFFLFMPLSIRFKNFCSIWYKRPISNKKCLIDLNI